MKISKKLTIIMPLNNVVQNDESKTLTFDAIKNATINIIINIDKYHLFLISMINIQWFIECIRFYPSQFSHAQVYSFIHYITGFQHKFWVVLSTILIRPTSENRFCSWWFFSQSRLDFSKASYWEVRVLLRNH